jgi:hypothetical protein
MYYVYCSLILFFFVPSCSPYFGLRLTVNFQLQTSKQTFVFMIFNFVMGVGTTIKDFHCCHVAFSLFVCCCLRKSTFILSSWWQT